METAVYNTVGKKVETVTLPDAVFGLKWNADLVHQVLESERANQRKKVAHVKMRGEVAGGGKKPWRQKGTGRARHGSIRSPIWRKGGVAHGPNKETDYTQKINRKMGQKAIATVLSAKLRDNEILVIDTVNFDTHKTKNAVALFQAFSDKKEYAKIGGIGGKALILLSDRNDNVLRATQNLKGVIVKNAGMAQVIDLLACRYVVMPKDSIEVLKKRIEKKK
jgi:large subunit ribosomal protein L4